MDTTLRLNSRIFRETTLKTALSRLEESLGDSPIDSDSIICEVALLLINRHAEIAEQKAEKKPEKKKPKKSS